MRVLYRAWILVSGAKITARNCISPPLVTLSSGCKETTVAGAKGAFCLCDTDYCNTAAMTSSFGHVIVVVSLITGIVTARLM